MGSQVPFQLGQGGEIQTALHTHILLAFFMLQFMGTELTGVSETSATHSAAKRGEKKHAKELMENLAQEGKSMGAEGSPVRLHITVLHHMPLQVAGLSERFVAHLALVGPHSLVGEQVCVQMAQLLEQLPAQVAAVRLDAVVAQDVGDQIVLGGVGLLAHAALPPLLVPSHVYVITVVHMDIEAKFFGSGRPATWRGPLMAALPGAEVFSWVERTRGEGHDGARHEYGVGKEAVVNGGVVGRAEEERRRRPDGGRTEGLLLYLRR